MSTIVEILTNLTAGNLPSYKLLLIIVIAFTASKILGKYVEHIWFAVFPIKNKQKLIDDLKREISIERAEHDATRCLADRLILKIHALQAREIQAKREEDTKI